MGAYGQGRAGSAAEAEDFASRSSPHDPGHPLGPDAAAEAALGRPLQMGPGLVHELREGLSVAHRDVCQHLAIDLQA